MTFIAVNTIQSGHKPVTIMPVIRNARNLFLKAANTAPSTYRNDPLGNEFWVEKRISEADEDRARVSRLAAQNARRWQGLKRGEEQLRAAAASIEDGFLSSASAVDTSTSIFSPCGALARARATAAVTDPRAAM